MLVMKFGGASLGSRAKLLSVVEQILAARAQEEVVVVVSAVGRTTDCLVRDDLDLADRIDTLLSEHAHALELLERTDRRRLRRRIQGLRGTWTTLARAERHAFGESLSSDLVSALLRARGVRARDLELTCVAVRSDDPARVDLERTLLRLRAAGLGRRDPGVLVVGGFAGRDRHGVLHLLGRGGSDTSATSIGAAIGARVIELWKDIDGIHATEPGAAVSTAPIAELHWEQADAIARSGMRILHEGSIEPAWRAGIPIHVRYTGHPDAPGTWIAGGRSFNEAGEYVA